MRECAHLDFESGIPGELYPLVELPRRRFMPKVKGRPLNKFTVIRWALYGRKGMKLRSLMVGGTRCTCDAWAMQFFESLTAASNPTPHSPPTPLRRERQIRRAEKELLEAGI